MNEKYVTPYITPKRVEAYIKKGICPVCFLRLDSKYHTKCQYLDDKPKIVDSKNVPTV